MIIVKLMGGMGNQMFQYALGRSLSLQYNTDLKLDVTFLLDRTSHREPGFIYRDYDLGVFNVNVPAATTEEVARLNNQWFKNRKADTLLKSLLGKRKTYFHEPHFHFSAEVKSLGKELYLDGFWQSEKYFKNHRDIIRQDFTFREPPGEKTAALLSDIKHSNAVCVNVRRGDFVNNPFHGTLGLDYYRKGEECIRTNIKDPHFFVFSDDIEWCEANLHFNTPATYVSHAYAGDKFRDYLELMMNCRHFIIPNSSFGWWAAWLCPNPDKLVIAPKKWFGNGPADLADLFPASWVQM